MNGSTERSRKWPEILLTSSDKTAKLIYDKDWSDSALGPIENWPRSLITTITTAMSSQFPALILWGADYLVFFNEGYSDILGEKQHWAMGTPLKVTWPEIWEPIQEMLRNVAATGVGSWSEDQFYYLHRYGFPEEGYYTFSFAQVIDEQSGVGGFFCVTIDATQKVLAARRLKTLTELAPRTTGMNSLREICRESLAVLSENPRDVSFAVLRMLAPGSDTAEVYESFGIGPNHSHPAFGKVFSSGKPELVEVLPTDVNQSPSLIGQDPAQQAFLLPIKPYADKAVSGFLSIGLSPHRPFDDNYRNFLNLVAGQISTAIANAQAQEAARDRAEALVKLDQAKTTFFNNVSHEFRTPLTLILGPLEDSLKSTPGESIALERETFELIYRNSLRLLKLVNSLLDFSRMEAGRVEPSFEPTDLSAFTRDLASQFQSVMEKGSLKFEIQTDLLSEQLYIDREMWEKIVFNLLSNAFKFTFEGKVQVEVKDHGREVELIVRDTGTGIPVHELPKTFQRFHRVQSARSRTFEGSGIGLALVQELVKVQGGEITVESTLGEGSVFRVRIPKGQDHLPSNQVMPHRSANSTRIKANAFVEEAARWLPAEATPLKSATNTKQGATLIGPTQTVLIVDDSADMREYLNRILNSRYHVMTAANGREALDLIRIQSPSLVISDIMMPEMNGLELLKELRRQDKTAQLPIILLSARAGEEATLEGLQAGADDYLIKPFSSKELLARVQTQLSMNALRSDLEVGRRAIAARDEFLSIASHELNTPLTPLKIQLQTLTRILEKGNLAILTPGRLKLMVQVFDQQVDKISQLIVDLRDVTRISTGTLHLKRETTDLATLVRDELKQLMGQLMNSNCDLSVDLKTEVTGDWDILRLRQVVSNLVLNSARFAAGKPIKVSVFSKDKSAIITVADEGPGIAQENLVKIFDRFERIGASLNLGGLGIGLYLCKQIVEAHGGHIQVESILGRGTKFSVSLPLASLKLTDPSKHV